MDGAYTHYNNATTTLCTVACIANQQRYYGATLRCFLMLNCESVYQISNAMTVHRRIEKQRLPPLRSAVPLWLCGGIEVNCCHSAVIMLSFRVQVVATVALRFCSICTIFVTILLYRNARNLYALCMRFVCILTFHLAAFVFFVSAFVG